MLGLCLLHESRPAPRVPDTLLSIIPLSETIWKWNYHIWVAAHLPIAVWLWARNRSLFLRFLWVGGVLSIVRGLVVPLTGLGPAIGEDTNAGLGYDAMATVWLNAVFPFSAITGGTQHVHINKDMFFSGHVATACLLWLYARGISKVGVAALAALVVVIITVFVSHLHYTIDVIGAIAIAFSIYVLFEGWPVRRQAHVV